MTKNILIDKLPTKTWNFLKVNSAEIQWNSESAAKTEENIILKKDEKNEPVRLDNSGAEGYTEKVVNVTAEKAARGVIFEVCRGNAPMLSRVNIDLEEGAEVKLVMLLEPSENGLVRHEVRAECGVNSHIHIMTIMIGGGDIYSDDHVTLSGDEARFDADTAYLGKNSQTIDYNIVADHFGKKTESLITVNGALTDSAKKVFRGTIDFKKGSADSVGSENETVPLILCAEENVEGTHGATIGELDADTMFYFESRGIDRETAEKIMAYAAVERLIHMAEDSEFAAEAEKAMGIKTDTEE
jgi:Fe-S cluster assembly protein SufD